MRPRHFVLTRWLSRSRSGKCSRIISSSSGTAKTCAAEAMVDFWVRDGLWEGELGSFRDELGA